MSNKLNIIEITDVKLLCSSFNIEAPDMASKGGSLEFTCEVQMINKAIEDELQLLTELTAHGFNEHQTLFKLSSKYISEYKVYDTVYFNSFREQERVEKCLSLVFSIIREDTMSILSRAGLRQIDLPYHFNSPEIIQ